MNLLPERAYWLAWSRMNGVGPLLIQRLHQRFEQLSAAWSAPLAQLQTVSGVGPKLTAAIAAQRPQLNPEQLLDQLDRKGIQFWTPLDADYPRLLREIPSLPPVLYYRGQVDPDELSGRTPTVGIVGTRNATDYGRRWTRTISDALAQHGFTVISGLALGIDAIAHAACLNTGGRTIAVLGTGIDVVYPRQNQKLYDQIKAQGLLLSDYPPDTQPTSHNFPPRNRIIAGLSRAILVMEASERSGALITARYANEFNRDLYALPGSLDNPQAIGCLNLANQGAQMILGPSQLLQSLGEIPHLDPVPNAPPPDLPESLLQVWQAIGRDATAFERIIQATGQSAPEVMSALTQLELAGLVTQLPGQQYRQGAGA
ncbi:MAG: DNA-processing protein DprA [Cyanobacteria bacterium P01_G01_bin.54]